jgi:hypothetical protein
MRQMIQANLSKKFSVEGLMTELEKIKVLILPDGQRLQLRLQKNSAKF